ncbi:MAG TPA: hypothetical protein VN902_16105 [Candidatus Acidoferrales bacterium]|nr:hypothetical protein [Candidatus Acidoferrales bacterium]
MIRTGILLLAVLVVASPSIAQTSTPPTAAAPSLNIPTSQGIIAKLDTDLDASRNKPGDLVQAETTRELKVGHDVLLKKGSVLTGHVTQVQTYSGTTASMIVIAFDQVAPKGGSPATLNVKIQALAPAPTVSTDSLQDGRGMAATNINSAVAGSDRSVGRGGELMATSVGVYGMRGVSLASSVQNQKQYSVVQSAVGDVKLKKGAQLVFKVPEQ